MSRMGEGFGLGLLIGLLVTTAVDVTGSTSTAALVAIGSYLVLDMLTEVDTLVAFRAIIERLQGWVRP